MARLASLLLISLSACEPAPPATKGGPQHYDAQGTIVRIEGEYVLIDHEDVPGFMDAMTMTFPVSDPSVLEGLEQGARVSFRIVVDGASYEIDQIEPIARSPSP